MNISIPVHTFDQLSDKWLKIPSISFHNLKTTRLQIHEAIQLLAMVGRSLLNDLGARHNENEALEWLNHNQLLAGKNIGASLNCRLAFSIQNFELHLLGSDEESIVKFKLANKSLKETLEWLKIQLEPVLDEPFELIPNLPYPLAQAEKNVVFASPNKNNLQYFSDFFSNSNLLLDALAKAISESSIITCLPQSFDLMSLISLSKNKQGKITKSSSMGFSPGDVYYQEPYFYLNLFPKPDFQFGQLPQLNNQAFWHTKDWFGAVLFLSRIAEEKEKQLAKSLNFFIDNLQLITNL